MTSEERPEWWKAEDRGAWPPAWHPPYPPSLSRPRTDWWTDSVDFRLRPHP